VAAAAAQRGSSLEESSPESSSPSHDDVEDQQALKCHWQQMFGKNATLALHHCGQINALQD
jgi:hypothetical protein